MQSHSFPNGRLLSAFFLKKILVVLAVLALTALTGFTIGPTRVAAQASGRPSPFVGHWQAIDVDGSDIRLTIAGSAGGLFQITWTESYISFCEGRAGIVRGTGWLNDGDPELLEADLTVVCFTTGRSQAFHVAFRYHPAVGSLSARYDSGAVVIFWRPGQRFPTPAPLNLRVNYGHDWVESFYEAGHVVWIIITESDGVTVKATAEVITEPKEFWDGEPGFQTRLEEWYPAPPDIQPYDWVFGWVDNGAGAQVQLGDIQGEVFITDNYITGTITAPWIADPVPVECLDWGSGGGPFNKDVGTVYTDGGDPYTCSWDPENEWDLQAWQDVGVGYFTPDGHWVANAFHAEHWAAFWTYELEPGFWPEGDYSYTYQWSYTYPWSDGMTMDLLSMMVAIDAPVYPGYALIQPWYAAPQLAWTGSSCEAIPVVHPDQPTRFVWGWVNDFSMDYDEALLHFGSFTVEAQWQGPTEGSVSLMMGELIPFYNRDDRWQHRCGLTEHPPAIGLRVNYGDDWIESFYEAGHHVWLEVRESDAVTVKATAELITEPKDFWGGETGFQTAPEDWSPAPPDIQPFDWVYATLDNGVTGQVQIGEISGQVDVDADAITGTIYAPWFEDPLDAECHPWGAPEWTEMKYTTPLPNGEDPYTCSWAGEWDIESGQVVGVGYLGPDGHWAANTFRFTMPSFAAYMPGAVEGYDWAMGHLISLDINDGAYTAQANSEQRPGFPAGETRVLFELWRDDFYLTTGDHILMFDEATGAEKELWVADLQVTGVDTSANTVSGVYDPGRSFWIRADDQEPLDIQFDGNTWLATFAELIPGTWGFVAQDDDDADGTVWDFYVPPP